MVTSQAALNGELSMPRRLTHGPGVSSKGHPKISSANSNEILTANKQLSQRLFPNSWSAQDGEARTPIGFNLELLPDVFRDMGSGSEAKNRCLPITA
jgi:hypothetical protein